MYIWFFLLRINGDRFQICILGFLIIHFIQISVSLIQKRLVFLCLLSGQDPQEESSRCSSANDQDRRQYDPYFSAFLFCRNGRQHIACSRFFLHLPVHFLILRNGIPTVGRCICLLSQRHSAGTAEGRIILVIISTIWTIHLFTLLSQFKNRSLIPACRFCQQSSAFLTVLSVLSLSALNNKHHFPIH